MQLLIPHILQQLQGVYIPHPLMSEAAGALSFHTHTHISMNINEVPVRNNERARKENDAKNKRVNG